jgi:hypothetical protein
MSLSRYADPRDLREYERKRRQHDPARSLVMNLIGFLAVITVIGVALIVAFSPTMTLYPVVRMLTGGA